MLGWPGLHASVGLELVGGIRIVLELAIPDSITSQPPGEVEILLHESNSLGVHHTSYISVGPPCCVAADLHLYIKFPMSFSTTTHRVLKSTLHKILTSTDLLLS